MRAMALRSGVRRTCLAALLLFSVCCAFLSTVRAQSGCTILPPSGPPTNRTVNVAMMFFGPPAVNGTLKALWRRNPMLDGWNPPTANDLQVFRSYLLWEERMGLPAAHGGGPGLFMLDGSIMRFNITWYNAGSIDATSNTDEYAPSTINSWPATLIRRLADPAGPYGRQHFVVPPLSANTAVTMLASLACEATQSCIAVTPAAPNAVMFVCQDPMPIDCVNRSRRTGSRRFENTVSPSNSGDYLGSGSLAFAVNQGIKRVFIVAEPVAGATITQLRATAIQLGLVLVGVQLVESFGSSWSALNTSTAAVTDWIRNEGVGMVLFISAFNTPTVTQLIEYWRSIDYLPAAVAFLAGRAAALPQDLRSYFLIESYWLPQLTGALFRALSSETNFETFPANATHDSPAVFADAYGVRFKSQPPLASFYYAARAFHTLTIIQKLIEFAQAADPESMRYAATRIAAPGVYRSVQFDQWGRTLTFDNYVLQFMPDGGTRILTPLGLGSAPIIPMPNWSEREYKPVFLAKTSDRVAFALAAVTVLYLLGWIAWLILHWHHSLIRVADPLSNVFSLCGLIVLVSSNFWSTFLESAETCLASSWLFNLGLTLGFAPLVLKNLRIWSLWHNSASFAPASIRQWHTVVALFVLLLIDIAILSAGVAEKGLDVHFNVPDPHRPSMNWYSCDAYDRQARYIIALTTWKLLLLILSMYLAYLLRDVPSRFSESRFIALCVYNVTIVLAVLVPVTATNAAGHEGTQLVRNFLIIFLCVTTASLMFVPKAVAMRRSVPQKHESPVPRVGTRADYDSASPVERQNQRPQHTPPPQQLQQRQQMQLPRLPALQSQTHDSQPTQRPATEPGQTGGSVVHSAHFPVSAPVPAPVAANGQHADLRTPDWPPTQSPAFQSMLGLSQIERFVEDDSRLPPSSGPRAHRAVPATRLPPRPAAVDLRYPAVLPVIPPSPNDGLSDPASEAAVMNDTMGIIREMPAEELKELHSSLIRRRRGQSDTPSVRSSQGYSTLPSPSVGNIAQSTVSGSSSSVSVHLAPLAALVSSPPLSTSPTHLQMHGQGAWASAPSSSLGTLDLVSSRSSAGAAPPAELDGAFEEQTVSFYHE